MGEVAVFEEGDQAIEFEALSDAGFILGSAVKHPYDLVTGHYSVHTNADSLRIGESNITDIAAGYTIRVSWHAQDAEDRRD